MHLDTSDLEEKLLKKIHKICPEARSCYHHTFASTPTGYIIHGKYSLPINEDVFREKYDALKNALDILRGKI